MTNDNFFILNAAQVQKRFMTQKKSIEKVKKEKFFFNCGMAIFVFAIIAAAAVFLIWLNVKQQDI